MIAARATAARRFAPPVLDGDTLTVRLPGRHRALSWAVWNGGLRETTAVVWRRVTALGPDDDPRACFARCAPADAVGLLTARALETYEDVARGRVRCVATVGLGNAVRAGDPPGPFRPVGTINLLCQFEVPLSDEALVEAAAVAAEARTAAVLALGVPSRRTGRPATGTGTDCTVVVCPAAPGGARYTGTHTALGAELAEAVYEAVRAGGARWLEELRR